MVVARNEISKMKASTLHHVIIALGAHFPKAASQLRCAKATLTKKMLEYKKLKLYLPVPAPSSKV